MANQRESGEQSSSASLTAAGELAAGKMLAHVGVKGMRWGTRKGVTSTPETSAKTPSAAKPMSDKQLKATVERLRLETELARLTSAPSSGKGKAFAVKVIEQQGAAVIGGLVAFGLKQALKNAEFKIDTKNAPKVAAVAAAVEQAKKASSVLA